MNFGFEERNVLQQRKMDFCNMSILLLSFKGYKNTKEDYVFEAMPVGLNSLCVLERSSCVISISK